MSEAFAKTIFTSIFSPNKRFFHIVISARNDRAGVLRILELIFRNEGSLVYEYASTEEDSLYIYVVCEVQPNLKTEDLRQAIQSSPLVHEVKITESKNGYLVDKLTFPVRLNTRDDVVIIKKQGLNTMINSLRETFGTGADVILFKQGYFVGKRAAEELLESMGEENTRENLANVLQTYSATGWGRPELFHIDFVEQNVRLAVYDNFECVNQKTQKANSHLARGNICGFFSGIMKADLKCDEIKCAAVGDDHCEFLLTRQ